MGDLRTLLLLIVVVCLGSLDVTSALALEKAEPPGQGGGHFGDIADPSQWPISSVGTVTVLWHTNVIMQCTGTLVGPKLVLTAAHCLYLGEKMALPSSVHFLIGLNKAYRLPTHLLSIWKFLVITSPEQRRYLRQPSTTGR